ncbi:MAG: alpha/beta hydrolase [Alphaproteobacteria bacterium]
MTQSNSPQEAPPQILKRPDGASLAYRKREGRGPTIVFLPGFKSDMGGTKAVTLDRFASERGQSFLRFDYFGHGVSSGAFVDGTIGRWKDDAIAVIEAATQGPLVLVGSSMGGWVMLLAALALRPRITGLVGVAPAPDFTRRLMAEELSAADRATLARDGVLLQHSDYSPEPTPITARLIAEAESHMLLDAPIDLPCPVRLLHGTRDPDVPWQTSIRILDRITSTDATLTLIKDGDHRLSSAVDLARLTRAVAELSDR